MVPVEKSPATPQPEAKTLGREFSYDISALSQVDPGLIHYTETDTIQTGLSEIRSLAVAADDQILVAGDDEVMVFDAAHHLTRKISVNDRPRCVAAGVVDGKTVVLIGLTRHLEIYNLEGAKLASWEDLGEKAVITSIAAASNDVFIADAGNRILLRYDLSGKRLGVIGKKDAAKNIAGFAVPSPYFEVGVSRDWVWAVNPAHHRLEAYRFDGEPVATWGNFGNGIEGFCGCCNPIHFTHLADGRFVTSEKGMPRVKIYSAQGKLESVVAAPVQFPEQLKHPNAVKPCLSLAVNSQQQILVADGNSRAVRIFTLTPASDHKS
jgi:hypothetical protein